MILQWLPVPGVWAIVQGVVCIEVGGHTTHQTRQEAVSRAEEAGLVVSADGHVTPRQWPADHPHEHEGEDGEGPCTDECVELHPDHAETRGEGS